MKSDMYCIDDLARDKKTCWDGVRNYKTMLVLKRAQRLSIQPVDEEHFELIRKMGRES